MMEVMKAKREKTEKLLESEKSKIEGIEDRKARF